MNSGFYVLSLSRVLERRYGTVLHHHHRSSVYLRFLVLFFPPNALAGSHSASTPAGKGFLPSAFLFSSASSFSNLSFSSANASVTSSALTSSPALILAANAGGIATLLTPV